MGFTSIFCLPFFLNRIDVDELLRSYVVKFYEDELLSKIKRPIYLRYAFVSEQRNSFCFQLLSKGLKSCGIPRLDKQISSQSDLV